MQRLDAVIIGGGIAGLWTLAALRAGGYAAILLEREGLGSKQTLASQGIIHGGTKYALQGSLTGAAQAIAQMPARWQAALQGKEAADLSAANMLSAHQYLWTTQAAGGKLTAFFAGKLMRSRMQRLNDAELPAFLPPHFGGHAYALAEPVLDTVSVLHCFAEQYADFILTDANWQRDGDVLFIGDRQFLPTHWIYTAGEANGELSAASQQIRPLNMVALRLPQSVPDIFGHCLGMSDKPKITITTHVFDWQQTEGDKVYWIGGQPAEEGVGRARDAQIAAVRCLLLETLPWWRRDAQLLSYINDDSRYICVALNRAEGAAEGKRPDLPIVTQNGKDITAYPTKLAFAPLVADQIAALLSAPQFVSEAVFTDKVRIAPYLWQ